HQFAIVLDDAGNIDPRHMRATEGTRLPGAGIDKGRDAGAQNQRDGDEPPETELSPKLAPIGNGKLVHVFFLWLVSRKRQFRDNAFNSDGAARCNPVSTKFEPPLSPDKKISIFAINHIAGHDTPWMRPAD